MKLERLGPYKLEKILGRGGMGAVYVGLNTETGERAAVKVLNPVLSDDQSFRERFKSEVETLKKLLHPNIVQLFGYGEQDDLLFYVMALVEGRSLQDELISGRRFQWREVARIGIDVAHALKHAHDRGVIHRDLKPANLLIDARDNVKLTDFGIAKLYGGTNLTADGGVLGTADYMAPEQAEGKLVTSRCDLYSLGSVLYALLAGRPPFGGKSLPEVIQGLRFEKPVALRRLNGDIPEELETIVMQLLEKDPQKRLPTAMALAHRLKAMEHALSMETRVAGPDDAADKLLEGDTPAAEIRVPLGVTAPLPAQTSFSTAVRPTLSMSPDGNEGPPHSALPAGAAPLTMARGATRSDAAAPADAPAEAAAKKTVFTTVSEEELRRSHERDDGDEHPLLAWLKIGGLMAAVLLLAASFVYYVTRPVDADALYAKLKAAEDAGIDQVAGIESEVLRFRELFPDDPRSEELAQVQEQIELYRLQRRFELRARRGGEGNLSPIEQAYVEAVRLSATDAEEALSRFRAIVDVFGSQQQVQTADEGTTAQCLDLARRQIERLESAVAESIAAQRKLVIERLARADSLAAEDPQGASKIRQGILLLYGNKEWAEPLVQEAREKLAAGSDSDP